MAKQFNGGFSAPTGFKLDAIAPIDDRLVVSSINDLIATDVLPFIYTGIIVSVTGDHIYRWNGEDREVASNWEKVVVGSIDLTTADVTGILPSTNVDLSGIDLSTVPNVTTTGTPDYISIDSITQVLTQNQINLTTDVNGTLPLTNIATTNLALLDVTNTFSGEVTMSNNLDVEGNIEADTFSLEGFSFTKTIFNVITGSSIFGSSASGSLDPASPEDHDIFPSDLTHTFTGSLLITGGLSLLGPLEVDGLNISIF